MFTINLESDSIYLQGSPEESAGTEVRGCVELCFKETTRVKSINLQFTGLLRMNWQEDFAKATFPSPQRRQQCKLKKAIYQRDWSFLPIQNWPHTMKSNTVYRFPFNLALPGNMAASITSPAGGSLTYEFKASVVRPFATKNLVIHRPLQVIRQYLPVDGFYGFNENSNNNSNMDIDSNYNNRMMIINKTYGDKVDYRIQLDKTVYQRGQFIHIHFTFKPLIQGLCMDHISCFLKEYTTLACPDDNNNDDPTLHQISQQSRIVSLTRDDQFPCYGTEWRQTETLVIPRSARAVHHDSTHPLIHIEHKLRLTICFVQDNGHLSELRVTMPIKLVETTPSTPTAAAIASTTMDGLTMDDGLPRYEDACLVAPYDPQLRFWSSSSPMVSPSPSLPSLLSSNDLPSPSYEENDSINVYQYTPPLGNLMGSPAGPLPCDYFSYQPSGVPAYLQRVPSYNTAIRTP